MKRNELPYPENIGKTLAMPNARNFHDLFALASPWVRDERAEAARRKVDPWYRSDCDPGIPFNPEAPEIRQNGWKGKDTAMIGSYCSFGAPTYKAARVCPTDDVVREIRSRTVDCGASDTFSFDVTLHDNGRALVTARHSVIIGSVWLAYIDAGTIPAELLGETVRS